MFNFNLNFLDTKYFGTSYLKEKKILHWSHIAQTFLAIIVIIFTIVRIGTKNVSSRADTWTMSVGFKTLVVLLYIVLTHRVEKLKRFASLKADMILSIIELLFWIIAFFMTASGAGKCRSTGCGLVAVVIVADFLLFFVAIPVALISIRHHRYLRQTGIMPSEEEKLLSGSAVEFQKFSSQSSA